MKQNNDESGLSDMLHYANEARRVVEGKSQEDFEKDKTLQYALIYLVEVIGEAASKITKKTRSQHPNIPWQSIVGMRNIIVHTYDIIDLDLLWDTVKNDLPDLIAELEKILQPEKPKT